jgi:hypothetical protein
MMTCLRRRQKLFWLNAEALRSGQARRLKTFQHTFFFSLQTPVDALAGLVELENFIEVMRLLKLIESIA